MKKFLPLLLSLQCCLYNVALAQQAGYPDYSFSGDGMVDAPNSAWYGVAVQPDGKVLAVGSKIARYNTNGSLDGSFGMYGIDTIKAGDTLCDCKDVGVQQDGKIIVAGTTNANTGIKDFLLIRYNTDGSMDNTFDGDGAVLTDFGSNEQAHQVEIQSDGKIVVAGSSNSMLVLSRYNSDGSLDNTFDNDGRSVISNIPVDNSYSNHDPVYMKLQTDGKILVGSDNFLARLHPNGSLDNSFGIYGVVGLNGTANDVAVQQDGKIVLACGAVKRLNSDGSPDNTFGNGGNSINNSQPGTYYNVRSIVLQPDGKILVGGYSHGNMLMYRDFSMSRYNIDGTLDLSFNSDGNVISVFYGFGSSESHSSVITPDLKIILAGYSYFSTDDGYIARYHLGWVGWPVDVNTVSSENKSFIISPNPTSDQINIEASEIDNGTWHLELLDVTGRQVLQEDIVAIGGSIKGTISFNSLPAGTYILQLGNGEEKTISRVVKY